MKYTLEQLKEMMDEDGNLDLRGTSITSLPEGLTVGGYLDLEGCTSITSLPEGLTVGGYLDLEGCTSITSLPEGLTVGGSLYLRGTSITSLPEGLTVGGYLDLRGTRITSLPEGLTVGGSLYLRGTRITSLPEGLTVGGSLYLDGCTRITSLPEGLTVGRLDLRGTSITNKDHYTVLENGTYVHNRYLYADDILTHVKRKKKIGKYTYFVGKIKGKDVIFDGTNYAHCRSFKEGVVDIEFKAAKDRGSSQYKGLSFESVVKREDAIVMYRIITGACQAGTQQFLDGLSEQKEEYTVREIVELTKGHYGAETFKKFFEEN